MSGTRRRRPGLHRRRGGVLLRVLLAALLLIVGTWAGALVAVFAVANRDGARPAAAIIVLGAAQYDGRPSPVLRARLDHAIALWHRGLAPHLIVTGGRREGDRTSEAATGRRYAVQHGVPDSAILMESEGRTTAESMRAAAALLAELERTAAAAPARSTPVRDTPSRDTSIAGARLESRGEVAPAAPPARTAILVSDPFHMLRLRMLARRYGIIAYTSPTRTSPISAHRSAALGYMLRESVKIPVVWFTETRADEGADR
ncbi:YdcF family protein [Roseisolibacter agri]|uniref:Membrane protein n=1 Tax=Roseisolibacter agri TaxID=2014610 RepID=A0AA37Q6Z9_9BACT|nr:YdcF family protein [Roseisolibacter agri]GLC25852.1 membrane protein [Roseisolibacter agri]